MPMRIYPAVHYTMGGLWVDYNLMSNVPGLYVLGEANFSDHGANRLGASARSCRASPTATSCCRTRSATTSRRCSARSRCRPTTPRSRRPRQRSHDQTRRLLVDQRQPHRSTTSTASSATSCGTTAAWPAAEQSLDEGARRDPRAPRGVLADVSVLGEQRDAATSRSRRPAASPTSSSSASCSCSTRSHRDGAAAATSASRAPDRGRRGAARRRALRVRRRVGVQGRRQRSPTLHKEAARVRVRPPRPAQLQVDGTGCARHACDLTLDGLAPGRPRRRRRVRDLRRPRRQPRHVVPRDARRGQRAADRSTARSRSRSTTTAARASAARAR